MHMGDQRPRKTAAMARYIDLILVILGQALVVFLFSVEDLTGYLIVAIMALNATGLGIRAKKTGRSVLPFVLLGCFFPVIVPVIAIAVMIFLSGRRHIERKPAGLYSHIAVAAIIFVTGAVVMDSFSLALVCTIAGIIWALSGKRGRYSTKQKLVRVGIYGIAFAMVLGVKAVNNRISLRNAGTIISACEKYLAENGEYPGSLSDLVPAYLPQVPTARYTGMSGNFRYYRYSGQAGSNFRLLYVYEAPFGRNVYISAEKRWRSVD